MRAGNRPEKAEVWFSCDSPATCSVFGRTASTFWSVLAPSHSTGGPFRCLASTGFIINVLPLSVERFCVLLPGKGWLSDVIVFSADGLWYQRSHANSSWSTPRQKYWCHAEEKQAAQQSLTLFFPSASTSSHQTATVQRAGFFLYEPWVSAGSSVGASEGSASSCCSPHLMARGWLRLPLCRCTQRWGKVANRYHQDVNYEGSLWQGWFARRLWTRWSYYLELCPSIMGYPGVSNVSSQSI